MDCHRFVWSKVFQVVAFDVPPIVSVQPLVNQVDGQGNPTQHGIINGVPVFRLQGGANAIIADPVAGDIGLLATASRDNLRGQEQQDVIEPRFATDVRSGR